MGRSGANSGPIERLKVDAEKYLLSPGEVDNRLAEIAQALGYTSLGACITVQDVEHKWGTCLNEPAVIESAGMGTGVKMALFLDSATSSKSDIGVQQRLHQLLDSMRAVWGKEYRNEHGGLNLKISGTGEVFEASLRCLAAKNEVSTLAVAYVDLDRFKEINDQCGHDEGNRALRVVYAEMHESARALRGLVLFDGGDEFIFVLPTDRVMEIASRFWYLRNQLQHQKFGEKKLTIDMTVGVVARDISEICNDFAKIRGISEALTKLPGDETTKKRGTISFETSALPFENGNSLVSANQFFQLGISVSKCRQFVRDVFGDERLNLVAEHVEAVSKTGPNSADIANAVDEVLKWFDVQLSQDNDERHLVIHSFRGLPLSKNAVAIAVLHGLSRAAIKYNWSNNDNGVQALEVKWCVSNRQTSVLYGSTIVWGDPVEKEEGHLAFGSTVTTGTPEQAEGAVVVVQIGFGREPQTPGGHPFPLGVFAALVRVDDRPRTGGGLPDFWQIALAQVITALDGLTDQAKVIVWGQSPETTDTYKHLCGREEWSVDEVSALTGLPTERVTQLRQSLPDRIMVVTNADCLLKEVYEGYQAFAGRSRQKSKALENQSVLRRAMAVATPLNQGEGIVCPTAALAYPIIIDTLRKSNDVRLSRDDSDQELRELVAFKLKLTNPLIDPIPSYLVPQKVELEKYARTVLLDESGFIRDSLERTGQVKAFVRHLSLYVGPTSKGRGTRRACLVVPHDLSPEGDPRPLGLISIWATPRLNSDGVWLIDFVFVWRTVEAFIGLPYSLYGSIQLANQLVDFVAKSAGVANTSKSPQLSEITYIALSLHLGSDEFHERVAKRIVDLASD